VTVDTELEVWRREWREQTEPFPALKRKIHRQNLRIGAAVAAIVILLVLSTIEAARTGNAFLAGLASGLAFAGVVQGGYSWRVRRGAWRPAAQTTLAYAELAYKRAVANARSTRFAFWFLLVTLAAYAGFAIWHWRSFTATAALVVAAIVIELFLLDYKRRRAAGAVEPARKLWEQTKQSEEIESKER
jgi:hypothetical protein